MDAPVGRNLAQMRVRVCVFVCPYLGGRQQLLTLIIKKLATCQSQHLRAALVVTHSTPLHGSSDGATELESTPKVTHPQ